jgi:hypothetical protein
MIGAGLIETMKTSLVRWEGVGLDNDRMTAALAYAGRRAWIAIGPAGTLRLTAKGYLAAEGLSEMRLRSNSFIGSPSDRCSAPRQGRPYKSL